MTSTFCRRLSAVLLLVPVLALLAPQEVQACGTACNMPEAPACADCQYTFFTRTRCSRPACHTCIEYDCWAAKPDSSGERFAAQEGSSASCPAVPENVSTSPRVVRVQVLQARS